MVSLIRLIFKKTKIRRLNAYLKIKWRTFFGCLIFIFTLDLLFYQLHVINPVFVTVQVVLPGRALGLVIVTAYVVSVAVTTMSELPLLDTHSVAGKPEYVRFSAPHASAFIAQLLASEIIVASTATCLILKN